MSLLWLLFVIIPSASGFLLQSALHNKDRIIWWRVALSISLIGCLSGVLAWIASIGQFAPVGALILAGYAIIVVLIASAWIAWTVPRWRKLSALALVILTPYAFWTSIQYGDTQSPESITQRHGDMIIPALEQYHAAHGAYPSALNELVPNYISVLPEALTTQGTGWLYKAESGQYALRY
jgi:hypothetical protein